MDANEYLRQLRNLIRKGSVIDVDYANARCRVSVGDPDADPDSDGGGLDSNWIPFLSIASGKRREWSPPAIGDQVILLCPMGDTASGVALMGIFSDSIAAPDTSPDTHTCVYPDGTRTQYDHAGHALVVDLAAGGTITVNAPGGSVSVTTQTATLKADAVTIDAEETTVTGAMTVQGPLSFEAGMSGKAGSDGKATISIQGDLSVIGAGSFSGEVTSEGISLPRHTHQEQGDGKNVSEPRNL